MIEISEQEMMKITRAKESSFVRQAFENWGYVQELKSSKAFQWFQSLITKEIRNLEIKILNPRIISDAEMAHERVRILEWRRFLVLLERKEKEIRSILEKNNKEEAFS